MGAEPTEQQSPTESEDDLDALAADVRERCSGAVADVFQVEESPAQQSLAEVHEGGESSGGFRAAVAASGRLRTEALEPPEPGLSDRDQVRWRFVPVADVSDRTYSSYRTVIESRVFATVAGTALGRRPSAGELESAPLPALDRSVRQQLEAIAGNRPRSDRGDWAVERVVVELYRLTLPELVVLQQAYADGTSS